MSTDLIRFAVDCGISLVLLVAVVLTLDRLGVQAWLWWASRRKRPDQRSSAKEYRSAHD